jgi:ion channel-forming bestrophin family protein
MHTGRAYRLFEFLDWTRREVYMLLLIGAIPTVLYQVVGLKWLAIPWVVVALLGTATAFIVGFKNVQTYNRAWEARQIWSEIVGGSRAWATMCRDYVENAGEAKTLVYRHLAWLTALRHHLREPRPWETSRDAYNAEYNRRFDVPEWETTLEEELKRYLPESELPEVLAAKNKAAQLLSTQGRRAAKLHAGKEIVVLQFVDMERSIRDFFIQQSKSERIKDFPYPRQFATVNRLFVKLFCLLLPLGLLKEFDKLNDGLAGAMQGHMVWLVVPFSVVISWIYTSLDQVGEATASPFEGGANDVPLAQICRKIEIDMREMLGEKDLPPAIHPKNDIVL